MKKLLILSFIFSLLLPLESYASYFKEAAGTDDDIPEAGDYTNLTAGLGLAHTPTGTLLLKNSDTLAGNPALLTTECLFTADGLLCEGTTADAIEIKLAFPNPAVSDKTITFFNATDTVVGKDETQTLTNKTLAAANNVIDADTAVALAADPADCATSTHFAVGVIASGAATCEAIGDADIPDSVTVTSWVLGTSTATQLTSPTVLVDLIDGVGAVDMDYGSADITDHTFITDSTGDTEIVLPVASVSLAETLLTAGRSLTLSTNDVLADAELYTDTKCMTIETPTDADNFLFWRAEQAITVTGVFCVVNAATSAVITFQECDVNGGTCGTTEAALTCGVTVTSSTTIDDAAIDAGDFLRVDVGTVTGTVGHVIACETFTRND